METIQHPRLLRYLDRGTTNLSDSISKTAKDLAQTFESQVGAEDPERASVAIPWQFWKGELEGNSYVPIWQLRTFSKQLVFGVVVCKSLSETLATITTIRLFI